MRRFAYANAEASKETETEKKKASHRRNTRAPYRAWNITPIYYCTKCIDLNYHARVNFRLKNGFPRTSHIMDSLPLPVISQICLLLPQHDLANLAPTCRFLHPIAMDALYRKILVVLGAQKPYLEGNEGEEDFSRKLSGGPVGSLVLDFCACEKLLHTLESTDLGHLIHDFSFKNCSENDLSELQKRFLNVLQRSPSLRAFHMDPEVADLALNLKKGLYHASVSTIDDFSTALRSGSSSVSVTLDKADSCRLTMPHSHVLRHLHCDLEDNHGLQVLQALAPICFDNKLQLESFSISHLHHDDSNERLFFASVASVVDIPNLSKLRLNIDCHKPDCYCFSVFMASLADFLSNNGGLPKLKTVEIEAFPQEDWLRPVEMLERVLEPVSNFLKGLAGLTSLKLDLATPSLKMTGDRETSVSDANKINRRLVDAFFLSMFETPDFGARLRKLELPDFLASFAYYKSDFMGSMLHLCPCEGCTGVLQALSEEVVLEIVEDDEDVDENQALYLVLYAFLRRLQYQKLHSIKDSFRYQSALLESDHCDWLADHFGNCTVSDLAVKTYIIHQLRPVQEYFSGIFENLEGLNLHGVCYERTGNEMVSVFHNQNYKY